MLQLITSLSCILLNVLAMYVFWYWRVWGLSFMGADRVYRGLLSSCEQWLIVRNLPKIPLGVTPDHLSALSILGACLSGLSLVLMWKGFSYFGLFLFGMALHWFGDSFDGALARHRGVERPKAGLLIDRGADIFSYVVIIGGLGLSPYLSPIPALLLLVGVLINAVYAILINLTDREQVLGIGGIGGTEGRLILILWVLGCQSLGIAMQEDPLKGLGQFEAICVALLLLAINTYAIGLLRRIEKHSSRELAQSRSKEGSLLVNTVSTVDHVPVEQALVQTASANGSRLFKENQAVVLRPAVRSTRRMRV